TRAVYRPLHAVLSRLPVVPAGDCAAVWGDNRCALAVSQIRHLRHLDPRDHAGPRYGSGHGHPGALGAHGGVRHRRRDGRGQRVLVRPFGRRQSRDGARLDLEDPHRRRGRWHGQHRRLDRRGDLHLAIGGIRLAVGEPGPSHHRLVCRADPDPPFPPDRALCSEPEMSLVSENAPHPDPLPARGQTEGPATGEPPDSRPPERACRGEGQSARRHALVYWIGFSIILALLAIAPLVLPEFWRRLLTEILIWGLLAMSSDILIGYTGMVSF